MCKADGEGYYRITKSIFHLEPEPDCYGYFDENCSRSRRVDLMETVSLGKHVLTYDYFHDRGRAKYDFLLKYYSYFK